MKPKLFSLNLLRLGLLCALLQPLQAASFTQETDVEYLASGDFNGAVWMCWWWTATRVWCA